MTTKHTFPPVEQQLETILRGCEACYSEADLRKVLQHSYDSGKPLRVKLGLDPSRPDIHIGHTVVLRKLQDFADLGHQPVLIIGDYTAMVGDPSGKSKTRPKLSQEDVDAAAQTYFEQVGCVIDVKRAEIRKNGEWFSKMHFNDVMELAGKITVARMLERDDFEKRFTKQEPISLHEFFYPLMQGYDSVAIQADVELGGTDQTFNLLMGRRLQEDSGMAPQVCLTMPLLPGLDGVEKMSKSLGNTIDVLATPDDMFGKTMSIPDDLLKTWYTLMTRIPAAEVDALCADPRNAKDRLAREIIAIFHDAAAGEAASAEFVRRFKQGGIPENVPVHSPSARPMPLIDFLVEASMASSKSEARRLIQQGGVRLITSEDDHNGEVLNAVDAQLDAPAGAWIKVGKRKWVRLG